MDFGVSLGWSEWIKTHWIIHKPTLFPSSSFWLYCVSPSDICLHMLWQQTRTYISAPTPLPILRDWRLWSLVSLLPGRRNPPSVSGQYCLQCIECLLHAPFKIHCFLCPLPQQFWQCRKIWNKSGAMIYQSQKWCLQTHSLVPHRHVYMDQFHAQLETTIDNW